MNSNSGICNVVTKSLEPEILLKIFLNLDCHQIAILRSVSEGILKIIDTNKSLWRILDWIQQKEESPIPALEMFNEKSASTQREVSILQREGEVDKHHLFEVLSQSKGTLRTLSLNFFDVYSLRKGAIELASASSPLNSLVLWRSKSDELAYLPRTQLVRSSVSVGKK